MASFIFNFKILFSYLIVYFSQIQIEQLRERPSPSQAIFFETDLVSYSYTPITIIVSNENFKQSNENHEKVEDEEEVEDEETEKKDEDEENYLNRHDQRLFYRSEKKRTKNKKRINI